MSKSFSQHSGAAHQLGPFTGAHGTPSSINGRGSANHVDLKNGTFKGRAAEEVASRNGSSRDPSDPSSRSLAALAGIVEASKHWSVKYAERIKERYPNPGKDGYVVACGISPSGTVHVGNLREVLTAYAAVCALREMGEKATLTLFWDDWDRHREKLKPLALLEDPKPGEVSPIKDREVRSFADRYSFEFEKALSILGIDFKAVRISEQYNGKGEPNLTEKYHEAKRLVLEQRESCYELANEHWSKKVLAIYDEYDKAGKLSALEKKVEKKAAKIAGADKGAEFIHARKDLVLRKIAKSNGFIDSYFPVQVFHTETSQQNTVITGWDSNSGEIKYKLQLDDKSVGSEEFSIHYTHQNVKLPFKYDWPVRWAAFGVHAEPGGIDHATQGSTFEIANILVKEVFASLANTKRGVDSPLGPEFEPYAFIGMVGMDPDSEVRWGPPKVSSSKGTGASPEQLLAVMPVAVFLWPYFKHEPSKPFTSTTAMRDTFTVDVTEATGTVADMLKQGEEPTERVFRKLVVDGIADVIEMYKQFNHDVESVRLAIDNDPPLADFRLFDSTYKQSKQLAAKAKGQEAQDEATNSLFQKCFEFSVLMSKYAQTEKMAPEVKDFVSAMVKSAVPLSELNQNLAGRTAWLAEFNTAYANMEKFAKGCATEQVVAAMKLTLNISGNDLNSDIARFPIKFDYAVNLGSFVNFDAETLMRLLAEVGQQIDPKDKPAVQLMLDYAQALWDIQTEAVRESDMPKLRTHRNKSYYKGLSEYEREEVAMLRRVVMRELSSEELDLFVEVAQKPKDKKGEKPLTDEEFRAQLRASLQSKDNFTESVISTICYSVPKVVAVRTGLYDSLTGKDSQVKVVERGGEMTISRPEDVGADEHAMGIKEVQQRFFKNVYKLLTGKETGIRLWTMLVLQNRDRVAHLMNLAPQDAAA